MNFINLTPHEISLANQAGEIVLTVPSTGNCRVATTQRIVGDVDGFPINKTTYGAVEGLPEPELDTVYVVSILVAQQVPERSDVVAPDTGATCVRENGQIKAVRGFVRA
jgi:hypothetical protein